MCVWHRVKETCSYNLVNWMEDKDFTAPKHNETIITTTTFLFHKKRELADYIRSTLSCVMSAQNSVCALGTVRQVHKDNSVRAERHRVRETFFCVCKYYILLR